MPSRYDVYGEWEHIPVLPFEDAVLRARELNNQISALYAETHREIKDSVSTVESRKKSIDQATLLEQEMKMTLLKSALGE